VIIRAETVGQHLQPLRRAGDATARTHAPFFADRDLAEIEMHV